MPSTILAGILALIALLHYYWAAGGTWAIAQSIPLRPNGEPLFMPGAIGALAVAFLLSLATAGVFLAYDPWWKTQFLRALALGFALRAVGDFRYAGFFKQVTGSSFAYWDTRLFSPLCVLIAVLALLAANKQ